MMGVRKTAVRNKFEGDEGKNECFSKPNHPLAGSTKGQTTTVSCYITHLERISNDRPLPCSSSLMRRLKSPLALLQQPYARHCRRTRQSQEFIPRVKWHC